MLNEKNRHQMKNRVYRAVERVIYGLPAESLLRVDFGRVQPTVLIATWWENDVEHEVVFDYTELAWHDDVTLALAVRERRQPVPHFRASGEPGHKRVTPMETGT